MKRKELLKIFNWKISSEMKLYKAGMLQKEKEEILASSYEIDYMVRIFESLRERSQKMDTGVLSQCIQISDLLASFYLAWLDAPGTGDEDLELLLDKEIRRIVKNAA